ncbi:asparagine synthase (glutamine-hydrolyzing) [Methylocystis sp. JAN1]|uniref:asparagine synthase (glutamine-hydrolyzing) n=1 Tax=Methylocystis sp. JAN1 TaxID=3397211 RepID=UPI003FA33F74
MCGIAGFVRLDGMALSRETDRRILRTMAQQLAHRGPDDEKTFLWTNVGLSFRRLAIVDLATGAQPLRSDDERLALICNGEIYNHLDLRSRFCSSQHFRTASDCEVLLHLYDRLGLAFLDQLNGIYAFALLDKRRQKLILCRDRLGVKPLFYYCDANVFIFGSEVKAVLAHPNVKSGFHWAEALSYRNSMNYPDRDRKLSSFFENIYQLPAGHVLEIDLASGAQKARSYWDPRSIRRDAEPAQDESVYIRRYRELLDDAVKMQLMADVECGIFLSGGIDSLAVARLASRHKAIHAFTVLSQSTITNGDAPTACAAAKFFGLPSHMVLYDWRELDLDPSLWRKIIRQVETPIAGAEQFYKFLLHAHARKRVPNLKVMLLGSGSDEFNGGYSKSAFNTPDGPSWAEFEKNLRYRDRESLLHRSGDWSAYANASLDDEWLISRDFLAEQTGAPPYDGAFDAYRDIYRHMLQMYQLWHEDRTSAANGVEARVPFLDHRIVELTYLVPKALHEKLFWDKAILREAMKPDLPDEFRLRPKTPFFIGEDLRYTRRLLYNLLCAHDNALLEEALVELSETARVVNKDVLWSLFKKLPDDPEYANVDMVLDLVNMGLLAAMGRTPLEACAWEGPLPVTEVAIDDWSAWRQKFGISLVRRAPTLDRDSVLCFADGIRIVCSEAGDPRLKEDGDYYILRHNALEFALEPQLKPWVRFLRHVDGAQSVAEILDEIGMSDAEVWKHLEEAVEYNVLCVVSPPEAGAQASWSAL